MNAKALKVLILSYEDATVTKEQIEGTTTTTDDGTTDSGGTTDPLGGPVIPETIKYKFRKIWEQRDRSESQTWSDGSISFTASNLNSIVFEAVADGRYNTHRGFIAVDNIVASDGPCDSNCFIHCFKK